LRLAAPQTLIDIADIEDLKGIKGWTAQAASGNLNVVLGALTTYRELGTSRLFDGGLPVVRNETHAVVGGIPAFADALAVLAGPPGPARINPQGAGASAYEKFPHPASPLPLAGVCAVVRLRNGRIDGAEVAVTGISPRPYRAREAERLLTGAPPTQETLAAAAAQVTRLPG